MTSRKRSRSTEYESESSSTKFPSLECNGLQLSPQWEFIGPFPAGMREGPFGPSLRNLTRSSTPYSSQPLVWESVPDSHINVAENETADGFRSSHRVKVKHTDVNWDSIRSTVGSAGTQHQTLLRTELIIGSNREADITTSPSSTEWEVHEAPETTTLCVTVTNAEEFALIPDADWSYNLARESSIVQWHRGDVYNHSSLDLALSAGKPLLGHILAVAKGKYQLLVKAGYEVRLFGLSQVGSTPSFEFTATIEELTIPIRIIDSSPLCVYPSVVEGKLAGKNASFGLQNTLASGFWKVIDVAVDASHAAHCHDPRMRIIGSEEDWVIPPLSTRKISFRLPELKAISRSRSKLCFAVRLQACDVKGRCQGEIQTAVFNIPLEHVEVSSEVGRDSSYRFTYLSGGGTQYAVIQPPSDLTQTDHCILALHGAGVEADCEMWRTAIRRQEKAWILMPTGLTKWGLDWTMASQRAWQDLLASGFDDVLQQAEPTNECNSSREIDSSQDDGKARSSGLARKVLLLGHSNGSQGALYALSHAPDSFVGGILCSGYVAMKEYVGNNWQFARNISDPMLIGVLQSSLSIFFNDLYVPHLVGKPVTIKFGSEDDNVPPWHSRLLATLVSQWKERNRQKSEYPKLIEVPNRSHWWPECLSEPDIRDAIDSAFRSSPRYSSKRAENLPTQTVRCVVPTEMGYVNGIKIVETDIPGQMASVDITIKEEEVHLQTRNVAGLRLDATRMLPDGRTYRLYVDRQSFGVLRATSSSGAKWELVTSRAAEKNSRLLCPMTLFLSEPHRILAVLPGRTAPDRLCAYESIAQRWAHDILLNTTINVVLVKDHDMSTRELHEHDYLVILGGPDENTFAAKVKWQSGAVDFIKHLPSVGRSGIREFSIRDRIFSDSSTALLYSIPHPKFAASDKAMIVTGTDVQGIERAGRLLPLRPGVPLPEWIVVGQDADHFGGGGILSAQHLTRYATMKDEEIR
ncbi:unnamed protein product [Sympodiomycopsis kandeliae]